MSAREALARLRVLGLPVIRADAVASLEQSTSAAIQTPATRGVCVIRADAAASLERSASAATKAMLDSFELDLNVSWMDANGINEFLRGLICKIPDQLAALADAFRGDSLPVMSAQEAQAPCVELTTTPGGAGGFLLAKVCGLALSIVEDSVATIACLPRVFAEDGWFSADGGGQFVIPAEAMYELGLVANVLVTGLGMKAGGAVKQQLTKKKKVDQPVYRGKANVTHVVQGGGTVVDGNGWEISAKACYKSPMKTTDKLSCAVTKLLEVSKYAGLRRNRRNILLALRRANCPGF